MRLSCASGRWIVEVVDWSQAAGLSIQLSISLIRSVRATETRVDRPSATTIVKLAFVLIVPFFKDSEPLTEPSTAYRKSPKRPQEAVTGPLMSFSRYLPDGAGPPRKTIRWRNKDVR